jgi:PilZ domain
MSAGFPAFAPKVFAAFADNGTRHDLMNQRTEGRKTPRYACYGPIEFRVQDWYTFTGKIQNLSLDGCFIQPDQPTGYAVGERLTLRFEVKQLTFLAQGIVRRVAPEGRLGIEILLLSERTRRQLRELIDELGSDESPQPPASR